MYSTVKACKKLTKKIFFTHTCIIIGGLQFCEKVFLKLKKIIMYMPDFKYYNISPYFVNTY